MINGVAQMISLFLDNPKLLKSFIDNKVDIVDYCKKKYYFLYGFLLKLAMNNPAMVQQIKSLTKEQLLEILKDKKPDLYNIIVTRPGGMEWWQSQDFNKFFSIA